MYALNATGVTDGVIVNGSTNVPFNNDASTSGWNDILSGSGTIESMEFYGWYGGAPAAIEVDGTILLDTDTNALQCPASGAITTYTAPTGNSIAYCWNSVSDSTINTNGTNPSQVSADPKSGFSIVKYTGTGSVTTVGHGLDKAPDFIIFKTTDVASGREFTVYSEPLGPTQRLFLNQAAAAETVGPIPRQYGSNRHCDHSR